MNMIRRPVDGSTGMPGPQPDIATPKRAPGPGPLPAAQAPFGLTRQNAFKRTAGGMAPRNGQLPGGWLQHGDAGRKPPDPLPQAQAKPAALQAPLPWDHQVPPQPVTPPPPVAQRLKLKKKMTQAGKAIYQALFRLGAQVPPRPKPPQPPVAQRPTPQEAAPVSPANSQAPTPGRLQVSARPGQAAPTSVVPVKTNHVQPQAWQQAAPEGRPPWSTHVQNPGSYPVNVKPPRDGRPLLHAQQQAVNVPAGRLPTDIGRLYQKLNLKVTDDTKPAFTNDNLMAPPTELGSGAFNTVFAVKLEKPDGSTFDGVFKPLGNVEKGWVAAATGIPKRDPQIAMRNIATLSYAQKLGIDVIPDTRVAVIRTGLDGPKLGLAMERAKGKPAAEANLALFNRPDVCAEVTKLQLLDHLTGQGDRHGNNYFIDIGQDGKAKVTGIDNDQCFGSRLTDPAGIKYADNRTNYGFRGTSLPPVVDTEMADKIHSLTHNDIREMLGNKLSEAEVQAAIARHEGVKQHINVLARNGRIIQPSDWSRPAVTKLLTAENSYVGREREHAPLVGTPSQTQAGTADLSRQPNADWQ